MMHQRVFISCDHIGCQNTFHGWPEESPTRARARAVTEGWRPGVGTNFYADICPTHAKGTAPS